MGLLELFKTEGKKFLKDALPGGLLNPEITKQSVLDTAAIASTPVPVAGDVMGLLADVNRYKEDPSSRTAGNFALSGLGLLPFVPAMTVWHGSPHKFDKFDMSKIGTGEGAQAYGHGLYTAESPAVAKDYQLRLGGPRVTEEFKVAIDNLSPSAQKFIQEKWLSNASADDIIKSAKSSQIQSKSWDAQDVKSGMKPSRQSYISAMDEVTSFLSGKALPPPPPPGYLYKVDIPDEAVARFLDYDNAIPESIRQPISKAALDEFGSGISMGSGEQAYKTIRDEFKFKGHPNPDAAASEWLAKQGIPGIRYLDGGSHSAGQGSFNFVLFDDQLPRILETNGVPTGLQPWQPGEWQGLLR